MKSTGEIKPLTSIRLLAAVLVVMYHSSFRSHDGLMNSIVSEGHIGVTLFFVLSGFLITLRYYDDFASEGLSRSLLYDFFTRRFARIYPLYAAMLTLMLIAGNEEFSKAKALLSYSLTHGYFSDIRTYYFPVAWTLTLEESFYLLMPLVLVSLAIGGVLAARWRRMLVVLAAWTLVLVAIGVLLIAAPLPARPFGFMNLTFVQMMLYTLFGRFFEFAVGIFIARLYQTGRLDRLLNQPRQMLVLALLATGGIIACQHAIHLAGGLEEGWAFYFPIAVLAGIGIVSLLCAANPVAAGLSHPLLVYGGKISYAMYLVHVTPLMRPVNALARQAESPWVYHTIVILGAGLLAAVLYELIEKPARNKIVALATRYKPRFGRSPDSA